MIELFQTAFEWVGRCGPLAPVYYVVLFSFSSFLMVPIAFMSIAGGFLFGFFPGVFLIVLASLFSSGLMYFISRYFLRAFIQRQIQKHRSIHILDHVVHNAGWRIVVLTRLAPIFPFMFINGAYGVSRIKFWQFIGASFLGFLPAAVLYAYLGSVAVTLVRSGSRTPDPLEWLLLGLGLCAIVTGTIYVTGLTRAALAETRA